MAADARPGSSADPMIGEEVGIWRISRLLGRGGMGRVYEAVQPSTGGRVAVKIMAHEISEDADAVKRFFAEARAVNLIHHEHIVDVLAMATLADGRPYIVMEYLAGAPLRALIKGGPLPLGPLAEFVGEALDALGAAHARGIVHRDLKPDNIFVTPAGHAKLLDFGLVKLAPEIGADMPATRTGVVMGTPHYMAPEYIGGGDADARSDLYAMGVILFEAATGRLPFTGKGSHDLFRQHVEMAPPAPRSLRAELPAAYEAVIVRALCKAPAERFADAGEMARALRAAAADLPAEAWPPLPAAATADVPVAATVADDPAQVATADALGGKRPTPATKDTASIRKPATAPGGLSPGTMLGDRYRIEEHLGTGGMGRVYRASDLELEREIALKALRLESERGLERMRREVRLASRITHPNVIRLYDFDTDGATSFVTMELVRGTSLRGRIQAGTVPIDECVRVARACALGLGAAHRSGIVHRDFKPENVLLDDGGRVLVVDFGVAGEHSDEATAASAIVGTSGYMAPEQANGQPPTPAADLYALGLVMHEMLTGEVPLLGRGPVDTAIRRRDEPPPSSRARRPEVTEPLDRLIRQLLAHDPDARPASADAVVDALAALTGEAAPPPRRRGPILAAVIVTAAAATGVFLWAGRGA
ncbi:MAG TPA: serine/threonine-protein kinase, partial [Kofleriaceae bacterium]|nr:serine/threonine-protein kinase [Kofleriaceae bacterium]